MMTQIGFGPIGGDGNGQHAWARHATIGERTCELHGASSVTAFGRGSSTLRVTDAPTEYYS